MLYIILFDPPDEYMLPQGRSIHSVSVEKNLGHLKLTDDLHID